MQHPTPPDEEVRLRLMSDVHNATEALHGALSALRGCVPIHDEYASREGYLLALSEHYARCDSVQSVRSQMSVLFLRLANSDKKVEAR